MKRILATLLFSPGLAAAVCFTHPDTGEVICDDPRLCPAGWVWNGQTQLCQPPMPIPACEVKITFPAGTPTKPLLEAPNCDRAAVELAVAVALSQLLGAPPLP